MHTAFSIQLFERRNITFFCISKHSALRLLHKARNNVLLGQFVLHFKEEKQCIKDGTENERGRSPILLGSLSRLSSEFCSLKCLAKVYLSS